MDKLIDDCWDWRLAAWDARELARVSCEYYSQFSYPVNVGACRLTRQYGILFECYDDLVTVLSWQSEALIGWWVYEGN